MALFKIRNDKGTWDVVGNASIMVDNTLSILGASADAYVTGQAIRENVSFKREQTITEEEKKLARKNINAEIANRYSAYNKTFSFKDPLNPESIITATGQEGSEIFNDSNSNNIAIGEWSHAEGYGSISHGNVSHAEGIGTYAKGDGSHAEGYGTQAFGETQHVQGRYNLPDENSLYAHIIGNGRSQNINGTLKVTRSNAYTLDWNGNAWFAGKATIGEEQKELATIDYVDSHMPPEVSSSSSGLMSSADKNKLDNIVVTDVIQANNSGLVTSNAVYNALENIDVQGYLPLAGGTMEGQLIANPSNNFSTAQVRNIRIGSEDISLITLAEGEIYFQYQE